MEDAMQELTSIIELKPTPSNWEPEKVDVRGTTPESWNCIDCSVNTAPGFQSRVELEAAFLLSNSVTLHIDDQSEIYFVKPKVWKAAGMNAGQGGSGDQDGDSGCLCIGCLEKRIGRTLVPRDFIRDHPFNNEHLPCTRRLWARREGLKEWVEKQSDGSYQFCRVGPDGEITSMPVSKVD
jgi:hypothetical protein